MKGLLSGGVLSIVDQGISSLSNFLTVVIVARVLAPADVGVYAIIFASVMILGGIQNSFITGPLRVFHIRPNREDSKYYLRNQFKLQMYCAGILATIFFSASLSFFDVGVKTAIASSIALIFMQMHEFVRIVYLSKLDFKSLLFADSLCHIVRILLLFVMWYMGSLTIANTFIVLALGGVFTSIYFVRHQEIFCLSFNLKDTIKENWRYGRWLFAETVAFSASTHFYIYMIALVLSAEMVAGFNVVQNLLNALNVLIMGGGGYLMSISRMNLVHKGYKPWKKILVLSGIIMLLLTVVIVIVLSINGEWLLGILYGEFYKEYYTLIPILGAAHCLVALNMVLSSAFRTVELPQIGFVAKVISAVFTIIFAASLLERWGLSGAAIGLIATQACWLVVYSYNIYKGKLSEECVTKVVKVMV